MNRVRMSLPYYKEFGWEPVVIASDENYVEGFIDPLLNETIPEDIEIHKVKAWPVRLTRKIGLGSLSLRSYYHFKKKGNELLSERKFDLIFFSTSLFHLCALGRYWKNKFNIPFVIDMQDPWRNDFYLNKPKFQRPPKFKIAYAINKKMEAYTMPFADGIMSVSQGYIDTLKNRYPSLENKCSIVIPFGTSKKDFEIVRQKNILPEIIDLNSGKINVVYVGTMTQFFMQLIKAFFIAFKREVIDKENYHFYFIGTNYNVDNIKKPVEQLAANLDMKHLITEVPERIPYFTALSTIMHSDILFIPGSVDANYNASKVYHNIQTGNPIFSIYNEKSLVKETIEKVDAGIVVGIKEEDDEETLIRKISAKLKDFQQLHQCKKTDLAKMEAYSAKVMVQKQVDLFNNVISAPIP